MSYSWVTNEMFNECLKEIVNEEWKNFTPFDLVVHFCGYEVLAEDYNNNVLNRLNDKHFKYWENVFFEQGEEAEHWIEEIEQSGEHEVLQLLLNDWFDWFPGEHEIMINNPKGSTDTLYHIVIDKDNDIVAQLNYNTAIPYIGVAVKYRMGLIWKKNH